MLRIGALRLDSHYRSKPMNTSSRAVSPLRRRMIEDMTLRKLDPGIS